MQNAFSDRRRKLSLLKATRPGRREPAPTAGTVYIACPSCRADYEKSALKERLYLCPRCGHHMKMPAKARLGMLLDRGSVREQFADVPRGNPIGFPGYEAKLEALTEETGLWEACVCVSGRIGGHKVMCAALDSDFLMGSMGSAVGEKLTRAIEQAKTAGWPLIICSASGGARMQEGIFSLMQMAKTASAVKAFSDAGGLYISILTHPTTGGVTASFASLGDIILAEPGALIGFAGPRVIEQTIRQKLPDGFQRSEFLLEHGFIDAVVPRGELRGTLRNLIALHGRQP